MGSQLPCIDMDASKDGSKQTTTITNPDDDTKLDFSFYHCFGPHTPNAHVYATVGKEALDAALRGFNAGVIAYGQTGAGKTYSMMGTPADGGLARRMCEDMFTRPRQLAFRVEVSYVEVYNERVYDLLALGHTAGKMLRVRNNKVVGPCIPGVVQRAMGDMWTLNALIARGNRKRTRLPRSNTIITFTLTQNSPVCVDGPPSSGGPVFGEKTARIWLADLAGSERRSHEERALSPPTTVCRIPALGAVIAAAVAAAEAGNDKTKPRTVHRRVHVPYRDSQVTYLMKECFGGNAMVCMLAVVSPAAEHYGESMATLHYASHAKRIVNTVSVNLSASASVTKGLQEELAAMQTADQSLARAKEEIEQLLEAASLPWKERLKQTLRHEFWHPTLHARLCACTAAAATQVQTDWLALQRAHDRAEVQRREKRMEQLLGEVAACRATAQHAKECVLAVLVAELRVDLLPADEGLPTLAHDLWLYILEFIPHGKLGLPSPCARLDTLNV